MSKQQKNSFILLLFFYNENIEALESFFRNYKTAEVPKAR